MYRHLSIKFGWGQMTVELRPRSQAGARLAGRDLKDASILDEAVYLV
jgi:hypothetical protein